MKEKACGICGARFGLSERHKALDGHFCHKCFLSAGFSPNTDFSSDTLEQLKVTVGLTKGITGKEKKCGLCGKSVKKPNRAKDGMLCDACYAAAGFPSSVSVSLIPMAILKAQIDSDDGESVAKRFRESGGTAPGLTSTSSPSLSSVASCPKCGSTSISSDKKGFGVGKAVVGAAIAGPLGLAAGGVGSKKVRITCLKCGHQWMAGKG